jgi:hypothetical protein
MLKGLTGVVVSLFRASASCLFRGHLAHCLPPGIRPSVAAKAHSLHRRPVDAPHHLQEG